MEPEKIKEMIKKARMAAKTEEFRELVDNFETFFLLFNTKDKDPTNIEFLMKLDTSHRNFWSSFEKTASSLGFTPDSLRDYFENSANFSSQAWKEIQTVQQEVKGNDAKMGSPKKLRNHNKKIRI